MCTVLLPPGVNPIAVNKYVSIIDLAVCGLRFGQKISPIPQNWGNIVMHKNVASTNRTRFVAYCQQALGSPMNIN
jgi:hypothetical protein